MLPRSRAILHEITDSQEGTEAEVLVDFFVHLAQQGCPPGWEAKWRDMWHPSKLPPRSIEAQQVHQICTDLQAMQQQWQAMPVGASMPLTWGMPPRPRRAKKVKR